MTPSEWADKYGVLTGGAHKGRWKTRAYQIAIMDALAHPLIAEVAFIKSAQIGWSRMLQMVLGYYIQQSPTSCLVVKPTVEVAKAWSKRVLGPFIEAVPELREIVMPMKSRQADASTTTEKIYAGETLWLRGANSGAGLAEISVKLVAFDETDRYPSELPAEGEPIELGRKRAEAYWDSVFAYGSTPTLKHVSKIEQIAEDCDVAWFVLSCPHSGCGRDHVRLFREPDEAVFIRSAVMPVSIVEWPDDDPEAAVFVCPGCRQPIADRELAGMLTSGRWIGESWSWCPERGFEFARPDGPRHRIGFRLWAGYAPNRTPAQLVREFVRVKRRPDLLKVFVNTVLGETWESAEESANPEGLMLRAEPYPEDVDLPDGVLVLTAGVDVQVDRVECSIYGWGLGQECWLIRHEVLFGDTSMVPQADRGVWFDLWSFLGSAWRGAGGRTLQIAQTFVDSGYQTQIVYDFCKLSGRWINPCKGWAGDHAIVEDRLQRRYRLLKVQRRRTEHRLERVGVDNAKTLIYRRYAILEKGPGYVHFPTGLDREFYDQLTAEVLDVSRVQGRAVRKWVLPSGRRNEALDCFVYALAAMTAINPDFEKLREKRDRDDGKPR